MKKYEVLPIPIINKVTEGEHKPGTKVAIDESEEGYDARVCFCHCHQGLNYHILLSSRTE